MPEPDLESPHRKSAKPASLMRWFTPTKKKAERGDPDSEHRGDVASSLQLCAAAELTPEPRRKEQREGASPLAASPATQLCAAAASPGTGQKRSLASLESPVANKKQQQDRTGLSKGGRPKKADGAKTSKYVTLTAKQRLWAIESMDELRKTGMSLRKSLARTASVLKCSESVVKKTYRSKEYWQDWCKDKGWTASTAQQASNRRQGSRSVLSQGDTARGCKKPGKRGYLGRYDPCRQLVLATKVWAETEEEQGHDIFRSEVLTHFTRLLASEVAFGEERVKDGLLQPEAKADFVKMQHKLLQMQTNDKVKNYTAIYLLGNCQMTERKKQRVSHLSKAEEIKRMEIGWQFFDQTLWIAMCGDARELSKFVLQPERWTLDRQDIVITLSDQIPVWLMPQVEKKLVHQKKVNAVWLASKARRKRRQIAIGDQEPKPEEQTAAAAAAENQPRDLVCIQGTPGNARCRWTVIARQLVHHYSDEHRDPIGQAENILITIMGN